MAAIKANKTLNSLMGVISRPQKTFVSTIASQGLHPLDPLTAAEVSAAGKACRLYADKIGLTKLRFNSIGLQVSFRCCSLSCTVFYPVRTFCCISCYRS